MKKNLILLPLALLILVLAVCGCSKKKDQSDIYERISGYWVADMPGANSYFMVASMDDGELYSYYSVSNASILEVEDQEVGYFTVDEGKSTVTFVPYDSRDTYSFSFELKDGDDVLIMDGISYYRNDDIDE